jgi:hypothetical protein
VHVFLGHLYLVAEEFKTVVDALVVMFVANVTVQYVLDLLLVECGKPQKFTLLLKMILGDLLLVLMMLKFAYVVSTKQQHVFKMPLVMTVKHSSLV